VDLSAGFASDAPHGAKADYRNTGFVEDPMLEIYQLDVAAMPARNSRPQFVASQFVDIPVRRANVRRKWRGGVAVEAEWLIEEHLW
jgi:hypothetical protein